MKKILYLFLTLLVIISSILLAALPVSAATYTGYCGTSVDYTLNTSTKVLTISGTGDMANYTYTYDGTHIVDTPWYSYRNEIKSIVVKDGVTSVGNYAFFGCDNLTSVMLPDGLTNIGNYAFSYCPALESIELPDSVQTIGEGVFSYDTALTDVSLGNGLTSVGVAAFCGCSSLKSIVIPENVTVIGGIAFKWCLSLERIVLPESLTIIGSDAFCDCSGLTEMFYLGSKDQWNEVIILDGASTSPYKDVIFCKGSCGADGDNLMWSFDVSTKVLTISGAGKMCSSHYTTLNERPWLTLEDYIVEVVIEEGVTSIGGYIFLGYGKLEKVTIPQSVTYIGPAAFANCGLFDVYITDMAKWCNIDFASCPLTQIHEGYEDWWYASNPLSSGRALYLNGELVLDFVIPDGVTSIGDGMFWCCATITSVSIPDSVTSIGNEAFYGCKFLSSIDIGNGVTSIGSSAFYNCGSLTSITIPDSVTSIGYRAFYKTAYYNNDSNWENGVLYISNHLIEASSISGDYTIREGTKCIADYAFEGCTSLESITIPDSVTSIGSSAFYSCKSLTNITIPDSVTSIGSHAFYYCRSLTSITIPDSVTSIGSHAFHNCTSLTSITIPDSVTSIGGSAFYYCPSLTSVTIPDSVTSIGDYAFYNCPSLNEVHITDIAAWCNIEFYHGYSNPLYYARRFYINGELITELVIPEGVTSIGNYAFDGCSSLESIIIPNNVTSIGSCAFYNCTSLTSVNIGDSVTSIGNYAFYNCGSLTSITIPDSVTSIGGGAFSGCTSLTSVVIPDSVTSIGEYAFYDCRSLTSITIPDSVTSIGNYAFYGCSSLYFVYYHGTKEQWEAISIGSNNQTLLSANIYIGTTSPDAWREQTKQIFEANGNAVISFAEEAKQVNVYSFTTWRDGFYYIYTEGVSSDEVWIYDENGTGISSFNNLKTGVAEINLELKAGETYYIVVRSENSILPEFSTELVINYSSGVVGDVSGDGIVNARDILSLKRYMAGTLEKNSVSLKAVDYNGDGRLNAVDQLMLKKKTMGLI